MIKEIIEKSVSDNSNSLQERRGELHVSDVGSCKRKVFLDIKGTIKREALNPQLLRVFDNGNSVHDRVRKYIKNAGIFEGEEIVVKDRELGIIGRYDCSVKINGEIYLVELKSINTFNVETPNRNHVLQLTYYMHLSGIHKGILLYECKGNQNLCEFAVPYDVANYEEAKKWFMQIKIHLNHNQEPAIEYDKNKYPCKSRDNKCPYWEHCYGK